MKKNIILVTGGAGFIGSSLIKYFVSKNYNYKIISFFAKKARGMMSRFIIENQIDDPEKIKSFILGGYLFDQAMSTPNEWVFTRKTME